MPDTARTRAELAAALGAARRLAGLDQRALATLVGISQASISNVENGRKVLDRGTTSAWLKAVKAAPEVRDHVLKLTATAHGETRTWKDLLSEAAHLQDEAHHRVAAAALSQHWQPTILPGILQTADYARLVIEYTDPDEEIDRDAALARRIQMQGLLREPGRQFDFVIAERLLEWEPDDGVLVPQLAHLIAAAGLETVRLAVLPSQYRGVLPENNFVIREDDAGQVYVTAELVHGESTITDPESVAVYQRTWHRLIDASIRGDDAIARIREEVRRRSG